MLFSFFLSFLTRVKDFWVVEQFLVGLVRSSFWMYLQRGRFCCDFEQIMFAGIVLSQNENSKLTQQRKMMYLIDVKSWL